MQIILSFFIEYFKIKSKRGSRKPPPFSNQNLKTMKSTTKIVLISYPPNLFYSYEYLIPRLEITLNSVIKHISPES